MNEEVGQVSTNNVQTKAKSSLFFPLMPMMPDAGTRMDRGSVQLKETDGERRGKDGL